jgi:hypothetical protein
VLHDEKRIAAAGRRTFFRVIAELSHEQSASTLHSEHGHDVTREYFAFVSELLRLYGIADPYQ